MRKNKLNLMGAALLLALPLFSTDALACGDQSEPSSFQGNLDVVRPAMKGEAHLACESNGVFTRVNLNVAAIYKCIGSPVTASLVFPQGNEIQVFNLQSNGNDIVFQGEKNSSINCRIEALSAEEQEQLRLKKEKIQRDAEETKQRDAKNLADTIAKFSKESLEAVDALMSKYYSESNYKKVSFRFIYGYFSENYKTLDFFFEVIDENTGKKLSGDGRVYIENDKIKDFRIN